MLTVYTIGHSVRSLEAFIALLQHHGVVQLADIRSIPRSRRHPHFCEDALKVSLAEHRIHYRHFPNLGGKRTARPDSPHRGLGRLQAYADHMATPIFTRAVDHLLEWASAAPTAMMCAEAKPNACHRQLTADALAFRGAEVRHITDAEVPSLHVPHRTATLREGKLVYTPDQGTLF